MINPVQYTSPDLQQTTHFYGSARHHCLGSPAKNDAHALHSPSPRENTIHCYKLHKALFLCCLDYNYACNSKGARSSQSLTSVTEF